MVSEALICIVEISELCVGKEKLVEVTKLIIAEPPGVGVLVFVENVRSEIPDVFSATETFREAGVDEILDETSGSGDGGIGPENSETNQKRIDELMTAMLELNRSKELTLLPIVSGNETETLVSNDASDIGDVCIS